MMARILQISDLHIRPRGELCYGQIDTNAMFADAIKQINGLAFDIDAIIASGDLTDCGLEEEYELLREMLSGLTKAPVYLLPGNHDRRENLRAAFPDHDYFDDELPYLNFDLSIQGLRVIGLDSVVPGAEFGRLDDGRLEWLADRLGQNPRTPTMIFMHHPPIDGGVDGGDNRLNLSANELERVLQEHPQVMRVCAGHWHQSVQAQFGHGLAVVSPSTCHQVAFDISRSLGELMFAMEPPGMLLHIQNEEGRMFTHQMVLGKYPGPYPYPDVADYPGA